MRHDLFSIPELAEYLGVTVRTLDRWRAQRVGPAWTKVGRQVRYRRSDVDQWLESHRVTPVREDAA